MNAPLLTALVFAASALAACGNDDPAPVTATIDVTTLGADLALPASAASAAGTGSTTVDPLADLAELAPPDTSEAATLPQELLPPA